MLIGRLLGAPLVWSSRGIALPHSTPVRCSPAVKMLGGSADAVQSYAGIFAESTGITKAWSLPGQGCETLLVQRTARNIEGENQHSARGWGSGLLPIECFLPERHAHDRLDPARILRPAYSLSGGRWFSLVYGREVVVLLCVTGRAQSSEHRSSTTKQKRRADREKSCVNSVARSVIRSPLRCGRRRVRQQQQAALAAARRQFL